jgi:outer membrane protein insertion porin family
MNMTDVGPDRQEAFPNRSYADLATSVDEGPTGKILFGVGATSAGGLSGNLIIHEKNFDIMNFPRSFREIGSGQAFRGAGQELRIELSPGTAINRAMVSFRDPYLFDLPIGFGASAYIFQRAYRDFNETRGGGRFSLGRQFGVQTYADVAFRIEDVNLTGFESPAPADFLAASGHTTLATLRPSIRFDNRNDPFAPNKGQYVEAAFEQGWGSFTFPKFTVEGRQYFTTGSRPDGSGKRILTTRARFGVTGRDTPVYERFYAGDFGSMRGFAFRGVGPHVLGDNVGGILTAIGSVEYQFPWTANDQLQQVIFCDFGTVEADYSFTSFRAAVGTGLRVVIPAFGQLPLAFDIAFPVSKEEGDRTRYFTFFIGAFW